LPNHCQPYNLFDVDTQSIGVRLIILHKLTVSLLKRTYFVIV
jgi:hypothetical protein